jgi:hypothetical protein
MRQGTIGLLMAASMAAGANHAAAQSTPWYDGIFANVSIGGQGGSDRLSRTQTFPIYEETASITSSREVKGGPFFDLVVGRPIRRPFGAALAYSRRADDRGGNVEGSVPDPIVFDAPRLATATVGGLRHREHWVALLGVWQYRLPWFELDLMVMAGPALVKVENDQVGDVTVTEGAGGPQLTTTTTRIRRTRTGGVVIADVQYFLVENVGIRWFRLDAVGIGGFVRYARATAGLLDNQRLQVGGVQGGGGLRIKF